MLLGQRSPFTHPALLRRGEVMPLLKREDYRERQRKLFRAVTATDGGGTSVATATTSLCILGHDTQYATQNIFYPFHPNNNLLYLCGASEERRCALVLETDRSASDGFRSILFLPDRDPETERWWGPSTGPKRALSFFGVDKTLPSGDVGAYLKGSAAAAATAAVHYDLSPQSNLAKFSLPPGLKRSKRLAVCLANLRMIKSPKEMQMMREGASVAADAFRKTMQCKYDNEAKYAAKMDFETRMSGLVTGPAYQAVVAGSPRSTYIHWVRSDAPLSGKELMLMDAGARHVSGYCSDISRTWPLSGRFEEGGQVELYQMVLEVQKKCLKELRKSPSLNQLHLFSIREMAKGILGLGGFSASQVVDLYPHHIGHHLGLDVHDCSDAPLKDSIPLREGMCITVEPGIYVPDSAEYPAKYRGLGVRIEDDVLITSTGGQYEVITSAVPKEISDIESLLA